MNNKTIPLFLLSTLAACAVPNEGSEVDTGSSASTAGSTGSAEADDAATDSGSEDEGQDDVEDDVEDDTAGGGGSGSDGAMAVCGNGEREGAEVCDDGINDGEYGGCNADCLGLAPHCGDEVVDDGEVCDDGVNDGSYDGCAEACLALAAHCGDGTNDREESCDDANGQINDGCNPDCTNPGELAWSQTWTSFDGATPEGYVGTPAGLVFTSVGAVQLAMNETLSGSPTLWNVQIDAASGEVLASHELVPASGGAYMGMASARYGNGTVIAARRSGNGPAHSTLLYTNAAGGFLTSDHQPGDAAWDKIEGGPNTDRIAVMRNSGAELVIREYQNGAQMFEHAAGANGTDLALGYVDSDLQMGLGFQLFGPEILTAVSWLSNGEIAFGGQWSPTDTLDGINAHALVDTNDGGQLVVGDYTDDGSPMRSVIAKFSGESGAPALWSIYGSDGSSTAASAQDVCRTPSGNFIVLGFSQSASEGHQTRVRKLTPGGAVVWDQLVADGVSDRNVVTCDDNGGALATGTAGNHVWFGRFAP